MSTNLKVPPGFDEAPKEQRIAFVQELWDRIAQDPERVPVPVEYQRILEERLKEYRANPKAGRPWSEVRDQLLTKLRKA
jgi:putative addiction module component (TIGR02574 family)